MKINGLIQKEVYFNTYFYINHHAIILPIKMNNDLILHNTLSIFRFPNCLKDVFTKQTFFFEGHTYGASDLSLKSCFLGNISVRIGCCKIQLFWLLWGFSEPLQIKYRALCILEKSLWGGLAMLVVVIWIVQTWDFVVCWGITQGLCPNGSLHHYGEILHLWALNCLLFITFFTFESQNYNPEGSWK